MSLITSTKEPCHVRLSHVLCSWLVHMRHDSCVSRVSHERVMSCVHETLHARHMSWIRGRNDNESCLHMSWIKGRNDNVACTTYSQDMTRFHTYSQDMTHERVSCVHDSLHARHDSWTMSCEYVWTDISHERVMSCEHESCRAWMSHVTRIKKS